jgi:hypothetical protein
VIPNSIGAFPAPEEAQENSQLPPEAIHSQSSPQPTPTEQDEASKEFRRYCFIGFMGILLLSLGVGIAFALVFMLRN